MSMRSCRSIGVGSRLYNRSAVFLDKTFDLSFLHAWFSVVAPLRMKYSFSDLGVPYFNIAFVKTQHQADDHLTAGKSERVWS